MPFVLNALPAVYLPLFSAGVFEGEGKLGTGPGRELLHWGRSYFGGGEVWGRWESVRYDGIGDDDHWMCPPDANKLLLSAFSSRAHSTRHANKDKNPG